MADDAVIGGYTWRAKDRAGVLNEVTLEGNALSAAVLVAAITTSSATAAFAANTATRRQVAVQNTGTVTVEISPTANFAFGVGWPVAPGAIFTFNYAGAVYARVSTGTGELRMWTED